MTPHPSRRQAICDAAVVLASRGGTHALTHQAIDAELGIARGSTSYYFRTRRDLVSAVASHLAMRSRAAFESALAEPDTPLDHAAATRLIADYLDDLVTSRRDACRARVALLLDDACDDELRSALSTCLFSRVAAEALFTSIGEDDPSARATELLDRLEGQVLRRTLFG